MISLKFMKPVNFLISRQVISPKVGQDIIRNLRSEDPEDLIAMLCDESIVIPEDKMDIFFRVIEMIRE